MYSKFDSLSTVQILSQHTTHIYTHVHTHTHTHIHTYTCKQTPYRRSRVLTVTYLHRHFIFLDVAKKSVFIRINNGLNKYPGNIVLSGYHHFGYYFNIGLTF